MNIKSGWKTTEFWMAVLITLIMLGVALGIVTTEQSEEIKAAGSDLIAAVFALAAVLPSTMYIHGRSKIKANYDIELVEGSKGLPG